LFFFLAKSPGQESGLKSLDSVPHHRAKISRTEF